MEPQITQITQIFIKVPWSMREEHPGPKILRTKRDHGERLQKKSA
jgi:hypothetical protein